MTTNYTDRANKAWRTRRANANTQARRYTDRAKKAWATRRNNQIVANKEALQADFTNLHERWLITMARARKLGLCSRAAELDAVRLLCPSRPITMARARKIEDFINKNYGYFSPTLISTSSRSSNR